MKYLLRMKNLCALFFLCIGAGMLNQTYAERTVFYASEDELGPMVYPRYLLWAWIVLSFLYFIVPAKKESFSAVWQCLPALGWTTLSIILYILLFNAIGLFCSTFLFMLLFLYILLYRHCWRSVLIAFFTALISWLVFEKMIGMQMPANILTELFN